MKFFQVIAVHFCLDTKHHVRNLQIILTYVVIYWDHFYMHRLCISVLCLRRDSLELYDLIEEKEIAEEAVKKNYSL